MKITGTEVQAQLTGRIARGLAPAALGVLLLATTVYFADQQLAWFMPFLRDFESWLGHPSVAGPPVAPQRWLGGLGIAAVALVVGLQLAVVALERTPLVRAPAAVAGLGLILGPAALGLLATLAEVTGQLRVSVLFGLLVVLAAVSTALWVRVGRPLPHRPRGRPSPWAVALWSAVGVVVSLIVVHVAMSPITEWDAIVYHAGTAKIWFEGRPSPPLSYGPSVGIEISGNYPPLFPATGAFFDVALNRFDDFYLRLVPPFVFLGTLLLMHGYARRRFDSFVAGWSVVFALGAPILVLYGAWPTAYVYLAALTLASIVLIDCAISVNRLRIWCIAGLVAGLADVTHFFGLLTLPIAVVGIWAGFGLRSWASVRRFAVFAGSSLAVFAPWLIRNLVLLHNPVYPLGAPPLPGKGLVQPIWQASEDEIRNNALGLWSVLPPKHVTLHLRAHELVSALLDRHLLIGGPLFAIAAGIVLARRGDRHVMFLTGAAAILIVVQLLPGWFWLRALVPAIPVCALLAARGLRELRDHAGPFWKPFAAAVAAIAVCTALALAVIGPDQPAWPTDLPSRANFMQATEDLGSTSLALTDVFGGDYQAWQWLNGHLAAGQRVATLDNRLYYYRTPGELFYLDGLEAAPLLHMTSNDALVRFFRRQHVKYVFSPVWSFATTPTAHPLFGKLPLFKVLGGHDFPLVGVFSAGGYNFANEVFQVGALRGVATRRAPPAAMFAGFRERTPTPPLAGKRIPLPAGDTTPRLFAVPLPGTASALSMEIRQPHAGWLSINQYDYARQTWDNGVFSFAQHAAPEPFTRVLLPLIPTTKSRIVDFGLYAAGGSGELRDVHVVPIRGPLLSSHGRIAPAIGARRIDPGVTDPRIFVPAARGHAQLLTFSYRASKAAQLTFNRLDLATNRWQYSIATELVEPTRTWHRGRVVLRGTTSPMTVLGPHVSGGAIEVKDLRVSAR